MADNYSTILKKLKNREINGAENIARAGLQAFSRKLKSTKDKRKLQSIIKEIVRTRPNEVTLQNALKFCAEHKDEKNPLSYTLEHFDQSKKIIAKHGSLKIKNDMKIFVHCYSGSVIEILKEAHKEGKKFEVFNSETRPKMLGRESAKELIKAGIKVTHMVDNAAAPVIRECDLILLGADAICKDGSLINKIGTELILAVSRPKRIPVYSCSSSWKVTNQKCADYSKIIDHRPGNEVWEKAPKKLKIYNPGFEATSPRKINAYITELGVIKPRKIFSEFRKKYPYLAK